MVKFHQPRNSDIECTTSPDLKNSDNSAILETNNDINKKDTEEEKEKMKEEQYSMVQKRLLRIFFAIKRI